MLPAEQSRIIEQLNLFIPYLEDPLKNKQKQLKIKEVNKSKHLKSIEKKKKSPL